jgi:hypothetical protein
LIQAPDKSVQNLKKSVNCQNYAIYDEVPFSMI